MNDAKADARRRHAENMAARNAEAEAAKERARAELAPLRLSLDPSGLPACDVCGSLVAPSRVRLHRSRCS